MIVLEINNEHHNKLTAYNVTHTLIVMVIKSVIKNYSLVALHYYSDNKNKHILISCFYSTFII